MIENPIASKKRTRQIQEDWNASTKKSFGQNFIVESGVVDKIAKAACGDGQGTVIEIGPGIGALTQYLCEYADQVKAVEIDPRFPPILEKEIGADNLEIIQGDFLDMDVSELVQSCKAPVRFASNLPYYITTPILFKLFESGEDIESITVMMQAEVADRFAAKKSTKEYNALSVITQYRCTIKKVMDVNRNVFWPSPNVGSSVLQFSFKKDRPLSTEEEKEFFSMVKAAFGQRRKTLQNNLAEYAGSKENAAKMLEGAGFEPGMRAQQLDIEDFLRLYQAGKQVRQEGNA